MRRTEALGIPSVVIANTSYEITHYLGSCDNGIPNARRAVLDRKLYGIAYGLFGADFGPTTTGNNSANGRADTVIRYAYNTLLNSPVENTKNAGLAGKSLSTYEQVKWALSAPLSAEEASPSAINPAICGALDIAKAARLGAAYNAASDSLTITAGTYESAVREFNDLAVELEFHDGLPLVIPTSERVEEMLAATTRDRNDILGRMKMRSGIITVEKAAVNAVMAGCKPEYFPIIVAAMEMYANGWDDDMMWYHTQSSGGWYSLLFVINGPLAKELGLVSGTGYAASGNDANNTIGRAIRLCVRNIGHNISPYVDTEMRQGRPDDHTLEVIVENEDELPAGWNPHHVEMGFDANQSAITMLGYMTRYSDFGGEPNGWTVNSVFGTGTFIRNFVSANCGIMIVPPATAAKLSETYPTKASLKTWLFGNNANRNFPIVAGGDPGTVRMLSETMLYGVLNYGTQLISGATLTTAGADPAPHSAPQDFNVVSNADGSYTLRWKAPASASDPAIPPITYYQVAFANGLTVQGFTYAATASAVIESATSPAGVNPGQIVYRTLAQCNASVDNEGYYTFTYANNQIQHGTQCFFRVRALNLSTVPGANAFTPSAARPVYANSAVKTG
ncbi:MAG: hypothetical protein LBH28_00550, partial [Oscillospiraceae bacterium]|nr:hypothetical protein [Oscillospiraceae bacterium]